MLFLVGRRAQLIDTKNYWRVCKTPAASAPSSALVLGAAPSTTTLHQLVTESYGPPEAKATFESFLSESGLAALVKGHRLH
ncbi:hypothetical protein J1614_009199 [Plenodomus biglobosus]|nr:hypothetical protein J1614_009199 [Plenodomus biglobosus]